MTAYSVDIKDLIAPIYYDLHRDIREQAHTYYNLPGGRGSGKSSFVSLEIVLGIMRDKTGKSNAIIFRLVAASMRDSVYAQIQWAIDMLGVSDLWKSKISPMQFEYVSGAQIIFRGLDDVSKLKSIKPKRGTFRFIWFEEFCELPGVNFQRSVLQSVVRGGDAFAVFRSFNPPISKNNWANMFVAEADDQSITLLTNYTQVPEEWLGEAFLYEAERLKALNPKAYQNEYMGEATGSGGEVFPNVEVRAIPDEEIDSLVYTYNGLDFGFSVDPAAFIRVAYERRTERIYVLDEIYQRGMSNSELAEAIKEKEYPGRIVDMHLYGRTEPLEERMTIIADSAEPKSIADLRASGLKCYPCTKFAGCVKYRVKWLQKRTIIIDPERTPNAHRELTSYEYMQTKDGEFLTDLPDRDNHLIDALSYSLDRVIYDKRNSA